MWWEKNPEHLAVVLAVAVLSAWGSAVISLVAALRHRGRCRFWRSFGLAVCYASLGAIAGISVAAALVEHWSAWKVISAATPFALACDVGTRHGWRWMAKVILLITRSALLALTKGTPDSPDDSDNNSWDSDSNSRQ